MLQIEELVGYMEGHPMFAAGKFVGHDGKIKQRVQWEKLATILNALGGSHKNDKQWQTVCLTAIVNIVMYISYYIACFMYLGMEGPEKYRFQESN